MTVDEITAALRSWVEQFDAMLTADPGWGKFTAEQTNGTRLVVTRGRVRLGRKGAWTDITTVMRPDADREQGALGSDRA